MTSHSAARLTGVLFIVATAADLMGTIVRPDLTSTDLLATVAVQGDRVAAGALLLLIAAFACAGIAISLYPILRQGHTGLALGSVVFRTMEAVMYLIAVVGLLSVLTLSQQPVTADTGRVSLSALGSLLLSLREHASLVGVFAFCLGALLYYMALYRSRLIPRWLSVWGILAIVFMTMAAVLALFSDDAVTDYAPLAVPIFLQEMVLAVWLIARGFSPAAARVEDLSSARSTAPGLRERPPVAV